MFDTNYEEVIREQEAEIRSQQDKLDDLYNTTKNEIQRLHQVCRNYEDEIRELLEKRKTSILPCATSRRQIRVTCA